MKSVVPLICLLKIVGATAVLCPDYALVFKYSELAPGNVFWEPLLPSDKNTEVKKFFENPNNCAVELDCGTSTNITDFVTFADDPEPEPEESVTKHKNNLLGDEAESVYLECNERYNNNTIKPILIQVVPEEKCQDDCFVFYTEDDICADKNNCKAGTNDLIPDDVTELNKEDVTTDAPVTDKTKTEPEKDLTALYVIAGLLGFVAGSALLFFGVKTVIAYFKSKSYNVGDAEANLPQNHEMTKYD